MASVPWNVKSTTATHASMFNKWDKDNDGSLTSHDLMLGYDTNQDGMLDATEIQGLSTQLSNQLDYNNSLIVQLQELERENARKNMEIHNQQEIIRNNVKNVEDLKSQLSEAARKQRVVQDIADNLNKQLREYRIENDMMRKDSGESANEKAKVRYERDELDAENKELRVSLEKVSNFVE